jgi:hypothetical protein
MRIGFFDHAGSNRASEHEGKGTQFAATTMPAPESWRAATPDGKLFGDSPVIG